MYACDQTFKEQQASEVWSEQKIRLLFDMTLFMMHRLKWIVLSVLTIYFLVG
jgi:hypothetical protein